MNDNHATRPLPSQRRADAETWAQARADYERGASPRLLADRYGLGERNLRRRAASEGWPRRPAAAASLDQLLADEPLLSKFIEERDGRVGQLLMQPTGAALSRFAFHRAVEAAAMGTYAATLGWLRVVDQLDRQSYAVKVASADPHPTDFLRARWIESLREDIFEADEGGDTSPDVR